MTIRIPRPHAAICKRCGNGRLPPPMGRAVGNLVRVLGEEKQLERY